MRHLLALLLLVLVAVPGLADGALTIEDLRAAGLPARTRWLPYQKWENEYRNYFERHYHDSDLGLTPTAIVMHYTAGSGTLEFAWNLFAHGGVYDDGDVGRVRGHLSSHFLIDRDGTIDYILPTDRRCRGAYGVNHVALSVEMVGRDEKSVLSDPVMMTSAFRLVDYLCQRFNIPSQRVWGHYQVSGGRRVVGDYTDFGDHKYPDGYPRQSRRTDPGKIFMQKLWQHLKAKGL